MSKFTKQSIQSSLDSYEDNGQDGDFDLARCIELSMYEDFVMQLADGTLMMAEAKVLAQHITTIWKIKEKRKFLEESSKS